MTTNLDSTHWLLDLAVYAAENGYAGGSVGTDGVMHPVALTRRGRKPHVPADIIVPDGVREAAHALATHRTILLPSGDRVIFAVAAWGGIGFSIMAPYESKHFPSHVVFDATGLYTVERAARVVAPPMQPAFEADLFLAGGISNCPDWQADAADALADLPLIIHNPRRPGVLDAAQAVEQIEWEHAALRRSQTILFWFPEETLCPITLFELGVWSAKHVPLVVGTHPNYARRLDVVTQLRLARPDVTVHDSLDAVLTDYRGRVEPRIALTESVA